MFAPESRWAPGLPLLDHRNRDLAQLLSQLGFVLEQLHQPDRAGEPGRAATDDRDADLDPLLLGIGDRCDELLRRLDRRGNSAGSTATRCPAFSSAARVIRACVMGRPGIIAALLRLDRLGQLRDDLVEVADHAEVAELEDRGVLVLVDRQDVLRALHPDLVLDRAGDPERQVQVRRNGLARLPDLGGVRYQPASTTARVAATGRPSTPRAARRSSKFSFLPSPRPPPTRIPASSMLTSAPRCSPRVTIVALVDHSESSTWTSSTSAVPPSRSRRRRSGGR